MNARGNVKVSARVAPVRVPKNVHLFAPKIPETAAQPRDVSVHGTCTQDRRVLARRERSGQNMVNIYLSDLVRRF